MWLNINDDNFVVNNYYRQKSSINDEFFTLLIFCSVVVKLKKDNQTLSKNKTKIEDDLKESQSKLDKLIKKNESL